ncbi:MAG: hypothetical protein V2A58_04270 [Planctomycetota bacterium]
MRLVAVKAATEEVDAIYRKHGRRSNVKPEGVARMAAAGWSATYAFMKTGESVVGEAKVDGESATVLVEGKGADGTPRTLEVKLVREDGVWKALPGIETLAR